VSASELLSTPGVVNLHVAVNKINDSGRAGTPVEYLLFAQRKSNKEDLGSRNRL